MHDRRKTRQQMRTDNSSFAVYITVLIFALKVLQFSGQIRGGYFGSREDFVEQTRFTATNFSIYLSVLCIQPGCKRGVDSYLSWKDDLELYMPGVKVMFFGLESAPYFEERGMCKLIKNWVHEPEWRSAFHLNFISANEFYERTNYDWYVRTTYDVYIHALNFAKMMKRLWAKHDPQKDPVFIGQMMTDNKNIAKYIHGGTGWIMSREAVRRYLNEEEYMQAEYLKSAHGDDVGIVKMLQVLNKTHQECHTTQFVGPPLPSDAWEKLLASKATNWDFLRECAPSSWRNFPVPVKNIAFIHNGNKRNYVSAIGKDLIENAPSDVYIQSGFSESKICKYSSWMLNKYQD